MVQWPALRLCVCASVCASPSLSKPQGRSTRAEVMHSSTVAQGRRTLSHTQTHTHTHTHTPTDPGLILGIHRRIELAGCSTVSPLQTLIRMQLKEQTK